MTARLTFETVTGPPAYVGRLCQDGRHAGCPGGFGAVVGMLCGAGGSGGRIVSTVEGAPCACPCHDDEEPEPGPGPE